MLTTRPTNDGPSAGALSVEYLPPQALKPYPNNARAHSKRQLTKLAASIAEFGFVVPVLIDGGTGLIAGHARVEAAWAFRSLCVPSSSIPIRRLYPATSAARMAVDLWEFRSGE